MSEDLTTASGQLLWSRYASVSSPLLIWRIWLRSSRDYLSLCNMDYWYYIVVLFAIPLIFGLASLFLGSLEQGVHPMCLNPNLVAFSGHSRFPTMFAKPFGLWSEMPTRRILPGKGKVMEHRPSQSDIQGEYHCARWMLSQPGRSTSLSAATPTFCRKTETFRLSPEVLLMMWSRVGSVMTSYVLNQHQVLASPFRVSCAASVICSSAS